MSGIGPVEPVNSSENDESYDALDTAPTGLTHRLTHQWNRLSPRARKAVLAAAAVVTVAAALLVPRSLNSAPSSPVPWPANVTTWRYLGLATPHKPGATSDRFLFAVTVEHGPPVTLQVSGTAFDGLTAHAVPWTSFLVPGGTTLRIAVEISVSDCSGVPLNADLPFLDVTLRNTRAIQHHSFIFGGGFSRDLTRLLRSTCDQAIAGPGPQPTGSANSQHAD
ncbi:hypothetical protein AB0L99_17105 [Streptomyces sp. NPDC051954]|uniref:hypothetical protein n=1 Tax=unclassified Streptomyces TaxID=2593676 RepID=UPI003434C307